MRIFLSYSHEDLEFAERLKSDLEKRGQQIWWDRAEIHPGELWSLRIKDAIEASENVLFIIPPSSKQSLSLTTEVALAVTAKTKNLGKRLVPILTAKSSDIPFFLKHYQALDLSTSDEKEYQAKVDDLVKVLSEEIRSDDIYDDRAYVINTQESALEMLKKHWDHEQYTSNRWLLLQFMTDSITFIVATALLVMLIKSGIIVGKDVPSTLYAIIGAIFGYGIARYIPKTVERVVGTGLKEEGGRK